MSGRIRTIKPELLEDEKTAGLEHDEWRVFVSLFLVADDYGNCRAAPEFLEGQTMWGKKPSRDFREILARLSDVSLVILYRVRGQAYLHITNWEKHQKVDKPGKPRVPGQNEADAEDSRDFRESLATDPDLRPPTSDLDPEGDQELPLKRASRKKPSRPIPTEWQPLPRHLAKAAERGADCSFAAEKFRGHAESTDRRCVDWDRAFDNWLLDERNRRQGPQDATERQAERARRLRAEHEAREATTGGAR